jgi:tRNA N6-adenosine threonylcarbamoyltransferase
MGKPLDQNSFKILGIETSCDETACSIVENGQLVLSSVIASQIEIHKLTGGVVPEVAAREHVLKIRSVIEEALKQAGLQLKDIDAIAATRGPGLLSSLITGYSAAVTMARVLGKPLIPVHHVAGHIYSNWLDLLEEEISFPVMVLTVSGGHNELVLMRGDMEFELIGETFDDAAGEAFDKVARLLNLGYPGGPAISKAAEDGDSSAIKFPRAMVQGNNFDFSFSGLKSAVLREVEAFHSEHGKLTPGFIADCAASFQECVADILSEKLLRAAKEYNVREVHLAGGVSANKRLREMVREKMNQRRVQDEVKELKETGRGNKDMSEMVLRYNSKLQYCTDNAAMIAGAAYYLFKNNSEMYSPNAEVFPEPQLDLYNVDDKNK